MPRKVFRKHAGLLLSGDFFFTGGCGDWFHRQESGRAGHNAAAEWLRLLSDHNGSAGPVIQHHHLDGRQRRLQCRPPQGALSAVHPKLPVLSCFISLNSACANDAAPYLQHGRRICLHSLRPRLCCSSCLHRTQQGKVLRNGKQYDCGKIRRLRYSGLNFGRDGTGRGGGVPGEPELPRGMGAVVLWRERAAPAHHHARHEVQHPHHHPQLLQPPGPRYLHLFPP